MEAVLALFANHPIVIATVSIAIVIGIVIIVLFTKKEINLGSLHIGGCDRIKERIKSTEEITKERVKAVMQMRHELVFRQMKYCENATEKVVHKVCDEYATLIKGYAPAGVDIKSDWSYEIYRCKTEKFVRDRMLPGLRRVFIDNHIAEKSDIAWIAHKTHIIETIHLDLASFIDEEYYPCHSIPRDVVEKFHEDRWIYIADVIRDCLDNARVMATTTFNDIQTIKQSHKVTVDY